MASYAEVQSSDAVVHSRRAEVGRHVSVALNSRGFNDYLLVTEGTR